MDILDAPVNRRLLNGYFPTEKLLPAERVNVQAIDFECAAKKGTEILQRYPELVHTLLYAFSMRLCEIESVDQKMVLSSEINCIINVGYRLESLNFNSASTHEAMALLPFVTDIDKLLWIGVQAYYLELGSPSEALQYDPNDLLMAWINLLRVVQTKEIESRLSLDQDLLIRHSDPLSALLGDWSTQYRHMAKPISDHNYIALKALSDKRLKLTQQIQDEQKSEVIVASTTNDAWCTFLSIVNDLAQIESNTVDAIIADISAKKKTGQIDYYHRVLQSIEHGYYELRGKRFPLLEMFDAVNKRMLQAPSYFCARLSEQSDPVQLCPAIFMLVMNPQTYNYLFIQFHWLRMAPSVEAVHSFFSAALTYLRRNLALQDNTSKEKSIEEIIEDFYI